jgi:hypothetical protein
LSAVRETKVTMPKSAFSSSPRIIEIVVVLLLALLAASPATRSAPPSVAFACACCAEPGEWYEHTAKIQSYEIEELRRVEFAKTASTYLDAQGFEGLKGLPLEYSSFNLSTVLSPRLSLTLSFKGERGESGALVLSLPRVATSFAADLHDAPEGSAGPILYKEWRFKGAASGSGFFKKGIAPGTKFILILQGRGNNCLSSTDFKNWRLDITGPRASYAFYGALGNP